MSDMGFGRPNNLSALKASMSAEAPKIHKAISLEETIDIVGDIIEKDKMSKLRETMKNTNSKEKKDREYYRNNFTFYQNLIKDAIIKAGIKTYVETPRGAVELPYQETAKLITSRYVGYDCLEDAMSDPEVTDVYCIAWDRIFVERHGRNERYDKTFKDPATYKNFIDRLLRDANKQLDNGEHKIVDFELYGNRGNVVNDTIASNGICLTLRKHMEDPITLPQIVHNNLMTQDIADMLGILIEGETNIIYAGITGSGKTTTIRALLNYYIEKLNKRALVLEDTPELFLSNPHTVAMVTFPTDDPKTDISLRDLNISALRMKPKYIVVGEVRGAEAESAVEGMETGHSTIFTMHGGNVWNVINRLVTKYLMQMPTLGIEVVERIIGEAINFVCIQDDIPGIGRRLTSIHEIEYNFEKNMVEAKTIVKYNFETNTWDWKNNLSEDVINTITRRGVSYDRSRALIKFIDEQIAIYNSKKK